MPSTRPRAPRPRRRLPAPFRPVPCSLRVSSPPAQHSSHWDHLPPLTQKIKQARAGLRRQLHHRARLPHPAQARPAAPAARPRPPTRARGPPPRPPAPPTPRQVTGLIPRDPARLGEAGHDQLAAIRSRCPELGALAGHVTGFAKILTGRHEDQPGTWIAAVDADPGQPELHSFTTGIRQDEQAVRNALTLPWSSGLVEGLNTRTKLIKRQMYGRAAFPLLRKRILRTS